MSRRSGCIRCWGCWRHRPGSRARRRRDSQWRAALEHEEALDLLGQAAEVRVRLAQSARCRAPSRRRRRAAPTTTRRRRRGPSAARCSREPALRELAAVPWGGKLGAAAQATLRRWATADTAPASPDARGAGARQRRPYRPRAGGAGRMAGGAKQQGHRARARPEPAHGEAARRQRPRQARVCRARTGGRPGTASSADGRRATPRRGMAPSGDATGAPALHTAGMLVISHACLPSSDSPTSAPARQSPGQRSASLRSMPACGPCRWAPPRRRAPSTVSASCSCWPGRASTAWPARRRGFRAPCTLIVPPLAEHEIVNTGALPLQLVVIVAPPAANER